jgi:hypothetical protein
MEHLVRVNNDRDRQVLAWLRRTVGDTAIEAAAAKCGGLTKPYLSAVCRTLGLQPPRLLQRHSCPSTLIAEQSLSAIKNILTARATRVPIPVSHR